MHLDRNHGGHLCVCHSVFYSTSIQFQNIYSTTWYNRSTKTLVRSLTQPQSFSHSATDSPQDSIVRSLSLNKCEIAVPSLSCHNKNKNNKEKQQLQYNKYTNETFVFDELLKSLDDISKYLESRNNRHKKKKKNKWQRPKLKVQAALMTSNKPNNLLVDNVSSSTTSLTSSGSSSSRSSNNQCMEPVKYRHNDQRYYLKSNKNKKKFQINTNLSLTDILKIRESNDDGQTDRPTTGGVYDDNNTDVQLTVENLFRGLKLNCDESVKKLDEIERENKLLINKQVLLLNQINVDCLMGSFDKRRNDSNQRENSLFLSKSSNLAHKFKLKYNKPNKSTTTKTWMKIRKSRKIAIRFFSTITTTKTVQVNARQTVAWSSPCARCSCLSIFMSIYYFRLKRHVRLEAIDLANLFAHTESSLKSIRISRQPRQQATTVVATQQPIETSTTTCRQPTNRNRQQNRLNSKSTRKPNSQMTEDTFVRKQRSRTEEAPRSRKTLAHTDNLEKKKLELQLIGACSWLIKAGYAKFVHMYENNEFPVSIDYAKAYFDKLNQHDARAIQRRIDILNKSYELKIDYRKIKAEYGNQDESHSTTTTTTSDEDIDNDDHKQGYPNKTNQVLLKTLKYEDNFKNPNRLSLKCEPTTSRNNPNQDPIRPKANVLITVKAASQQDNANRIIPTSLPSSCSVNTSRFQVLNSIVHYSDQLAWQKGTCENLPPDTMGNLQLRLNSMSAKQIAILKSFAHVRLTALMESQTNAIVCQKSGWDRLRVVPNFIRKHQKWQAENSLKNKRVFGVPIKVNMERTGQAIPVAIYQIINYLRENSGNVVGIFRKNGSKAQMNQMRAAIEADSSISAFVTLHDNNDIINLADLLKQYLRELPECLLTNKLSNTLIDIFTYVPDSQRRLRAVQNCLLLLEDENREVLQFLLDFFNRITQHSDQTKMDARNIAICLSPTLLAIDNLLVVSSSSSLAYQTGTTSSSPASPSSLSSQNHSLLSKQCNASLDCLTYMIENPKIIFEIDSRIYFECNFNMSDYAMAPTIPNLLKTFHVNTIHAFIDDRMDEMLKDVKDKSRTWTTVAPIHDCGLNVEIYSKKSEYPLRTWKLALDIDGSSVEDVFHKIYYERSDWDDDLVTIKTIEIIDNRTEIVQYETKLHPSQMLRGYCELRAWKSTIQAHTAKSMYTVFLTSVQHSDASRVGEITAVTFKNCYIIEELDVNKCRLHQIYKADYKGYSPEWYSKFQGHVLAKYLNSIKQALEHHR